MNNDFIFNFKLIKVTMFYRLVLCLLFLTPFVNSLLDWQYHNNSQLENYLKKFTASIRAPIRAKLYSIGKSVKNNDLWVVRITTANEGKIGVPNIKLIGTIHGNEPVGREILLHFMEHLRDNYKSDPKITWLLDNTKIHILPNLNPDGFALAHENMCEGEHGRNNGRKGKDLNRNFPDYFHENRIPEEPETNAVKKWLSEVPFILSAALHGGALVANYPFDTVKEMTSLPTNPPSLTPDNDVFVHLAKTYAQNHLTMYKGDGCETESKFDGGITNGAAWYSIIGGMQDYNYAFHGCMEITLEISCCKYPSAEKLPQFWKENKKALINYCKQAHRGVTGQTLDASTLNPIRASLKVSGRNITFHSTKSGEFWRLLLPGNYRLEVSAKGYYDRIVPFHVENFNISLPKLTFLKILMLNSTISTTAQQRTTETTTDLTEPALDGASTDLFTNNEIVESGDKPINARQIVLDKEENSAKTNKLNCYLFVLCALFLCCFSNSLKYQ